MRLFCVPFAGGGASAYRTWADSLPPEIEVCPIQLPGRETRFNEPAFKHAKPLTEALATALSSWLTLPFAFFGHSLGALLSFELARELRRRGGPAPEHLFVSARRAPHLVNPDPMHGLSDTQFIDRLRRMEGTPEAVLKEPELLQLFMPVLRADLSVNDTYVPGEEAPLDLPISAFGGTIDGRAAPAEIEAWREYTQREFSVVFFPGGHFYFKNDPEPLLRAMKPALLRITAGGPTTASP